MLGLCYWVGVNEKIQNTGEPMPNFFLGVDFAAVLGLCYWVGVNEKVQNTGEPLPNFFLRCGLYCFSSIDFFQNLSPPHPLTRVLLFSEHWADSDLHCNCCAPPPPTWEPCQSSKRTTRKCKIFVTNMVFECLTLLKIEVIEYGKMGFKMA